MVSKAEQEAIKRGSEQYVNEHNSFINNYLKNRKLRVPSVKRNS